MFGLYIHIPYCLQRCRYCDFATYVYNEILPPKDYVHLLKKELWQKSSLFPEKNLRSLYFGGGTPSLLEAPLILSLIDEIAKTGLNIDRQTEITLEINPATLDKQKIRTLLDHGVNRFSVGAQTFHDHHLKAAGRKHSSEETRQTLDLLQNFGVNYSFDLLFALPHQTLDELESDLQTIHHYSPPHLSAYCLTVPEGHPMSSNRPLEDQQIQMFQRIEESLLKNDLRRYEISNFAKPGFESKHNLLYWQDQNYIGLGLSAHSYLKTEGPWGSRFWNPSSIEKYKDAVLAEPPSVLPHLKKLGHLETLNEDESLFDFSHTALRLESGLDLHSLNNKFAPTKTSILRERLDHLAQDNYVIKANDCWRLSEKGRHLSNYVFSRLH